MRVKLVDNQEELKRTIVIRRLRKYGYTKVEGKTYRELKVKLAVLQIIEDRPGYGWF